MKRFKVKTVVMIGFAGLLLFYWMILDRNDHTEMVQSKETRPQTKTEETSSFIQNEASNPLKGLWEGIEFHRKTREQEVEQLKLKRDAEAKEKRRLAHWKANFPYKKTYHPTLTFDPSRYNPKDPTTFSGDPEMEMAVKNHGYLVAFYNNPQIYSAEFEQLYHLLKEIDRADNTKIIGEIFISLIFYHKIQHYYDPEDLWAKKKDMPLANQTGPEKSMIEVWVPFDGRTTWGEKAERYRSTIVGLLGLSKYWPEKEPLNPEDARAFRDRLIHEIPSENLIKMQDAVVLPNGELGAFGYYSAAEEALTPGDKLLYR